MKLVRIKTTRELDFYSIEVTPGPEIPLFESKVSAGFPSPAEDYVELKLDLNQRLVTKPHATFCVNVKGRSMEGANIFDGDMLIVDRSKEPKDGCIVIGVVNGEFTVKRIKREKGELYLMPESKDFQPMKITEEMEFQVWGVVTYIIHKA